MSERATVDQVTTRLLELSVDEATIEKIKTELGVETIDDLTGLKEADLTGIGMKPIPARKVVAALSKPAADTAGAVTSVSFDNILPPVPTDASWLEGLRTGGVLKVDQSTVISVVRATLAHRAGLFTIPDKLVDLMERFADTNDDPVDAEYFKLRKLLTRRNYADVFAAIDGLDGNYVTDARKKQLFSRADDKLWPAIIEFYGQLKSWQEAWMQGAANPMVLMAAMVNTSSTGGMMPPGMMQPPDTGTLRDSADAMNDAINRVFAGTGVQIAAALAYDASRIKETLDNDRLPAMIGAANREQMLKQLGVAVSATYPRLEANVTRFVLGVMKLQDQPAGTEELQYLSALTMLGSQIPWNQLDGGRSIRPTGIGGRRDGAL